MKIILTVSAMVLMSFNLHAFDTMEISGVFNMGFGIGGDSLYQDEDAIIIHHTFYNDIVETKDINIRAGEGLYLGGGFLFSFPQNYFEIQGTLNYFDSYDELSNGDYGFSKIPLDVTVYYTLQNHHFGAGLSYHFNPELIVDYGIYDFSVSFKNALGYTVEYNYGLNSFRIFAKYLFITYEENETPFGFEANGDSFQFGVSWMFK